MSITITPELKNQFHQYVKDAVESPQNLEFLLDNLGHPLKCDYSLESLEKIETVFWQFVIKGIPDDLSDLDHFASLMGQYLGESIIHKVGGNWVQSKEQNHTFGQPCIDGFGGKLWDRVFPVELARCIRDLPKSNPNFPGVRGRRVFAAAFERTTSINRGNRAE